MAPVAPWSFLTSHGKALVIMTRDPEILLRDLAEGLALSERRTHAIVSDLTASGYVVKRRQGRRNHYEVQTQLPLPEFSLEGDGRAIGAVLSVLVAPPDRRRWVRRALDRAPRPA